MKTKFYIFLFLIFLSHFAFGQASNISNFFISVDFEKDIPVCEIEVFYYTASNNHIERINFETDTSKNTIEISGVHNYVVGAGLPVIVFSHKKKMIYNSHFDNYGSINPRKEKEEAEIQKLYYLVISIAGFSSANEDFREKLKFSNEKPNIIIEHEYINGNARYNVSNEPDYFLPVYKMSISNQLVKVNPKNEN